MTYETVYEVQWDGTRQRGAYLFCEAEVPQEAPRETASDVTRESLRGHVADTLAHGPATMRGIAAALGVEVQAVNVALYTLRRDGVVHVRGKAWNQRRGRPEHLYRLVGAEY